VNCSSPGLATRLRAQISAEIDCVEIDRPAGTWARIDDERAGVRRCRIGIAGSGAGVMLRTAGSSAARINARRPSTVATGIPRRTLGANEQRTARLGIGIANASEDSRKKQRCPPADVSG
jgi:hypothetical protein